jgi:FtsP/CotA-like multicopper oxidase with cupredoxin domain
MTEISRREIVAGTAALALTSASTSALAQQRAKAAPAGPANVINLECGFITKTIDGIPCRLRAYNGTIPGPLMQIAPGQKLTINLKNSLSLYTYGAENWPHDHNVPHNLGSTNLHLHGMDIIPHLFEPVGTSDPRAEMIEIKPGDTKQYVFQIPIDHPPGFDWYHPHHHGSTAVQAVTGMAGGIVVSGTIDEVPAIKAARQEFLVIQDIGLFPTDPVVPPGPDGKGGSPGTPPEDLGFPPKTDISSYWTYLSKQNAIWQTFASNVTIYDPTIQPPGNPYVVQPNLKGGFTTGDYARRYYLLNGEPFFKETHDNNNPTAPTPVQMTPPVINMQPGEVVRFRMLNGSSDNYMPIAVQGLDMHLLALDGVNFPRVRTIAPVPIPDPPVVAPPADNKTLPYEGQIQLAPANRAEFLIKADRPGQYNIVQLAQNQQFLFSAQKIIATINVAGAPKNMALPTALPPPTRLYPLIRPDQVQVMRTIFFSDQFPGSQNPYVGIDFLLNGQQYQVTDDNYVVDLDGIEEWHLVVGDSQHGGSEGHPFHIHVNSFEVISVNGAKLSPGTFKDTVWIPAKSKVVIRMKFKEWDGKSVFHCHILPHEDTGMMQNFLIKKRGGPVPEALAAAPLLSPTRLTATMEKMEMPGHDPNHK